MTSAAIYVAIETQRSKKLGKVEKNKENKRTSLLQTSFDLFLSKGFNKTTVSDIAQSAGLAKGTFYLYFHDKYDLRDQLIAKKSAQILLEAMNALDEDAVPKDSFEDELLAIVDYIVDYFSENKHLLKFITKNLSWGLYQHAAQNESDELNAFYTKYLAALDRDGIACEQPEMMLYTIVELVSGSAYSCILHSSPVPMEEYRPYLHKCIRQIIAAFTEEN